MASSDDDIQFDFFDDEPATAESAQPARGRLPQRVGRGPRGPRRPLGPTQASGPLLRLLVVVFFVIFLVLVLGLLIQGCASTSRGSVYSHYMAKVSTIAQQSTLDGQHTVTTLTSPGLSVASIVSKLDAIVNDEKQNVANARQLVPPGRLRNEHVDLIEALQLRVSGVAGLAKAFHNASSKTKPADEAVLLSGQAYRLLASDVIWSDLFQQPARNQLVDDHVTDVVVPTSQFLASPDLFITQQAMVSIVERINGTSSTGTGNQQTCGTDLHGTDIASVVALPNGAGGTTETLTESKLNTITTSSNLVYQVTIDDGGNFQEVHIPITLTIDPAQASGNPVTKTKTLQVIDPSQSATVTFSDLGSPPFGGETKLRVDVGKVPCETNTGNNSAQYRVIFTLPG